LSRIVEAQRQAAGATGCGFFDTRAAMGGPGSIDRWARASPRLAQRDRVHLTARGYDRIAASLEKALLAGTPAAGDP
jgi:lysophospholipase L1-like esterase